MTTGGDDQHSKAQGARSERRVRPNPELVTTRLGNELVIFHLGTDRFYAVNGTGARVWDLLGDGYKPTQIRQQLLQEYDVEETRLAEEIAELLSSFVDEQLLVADDHQ